MKSPSSLVCSLLAVFVVVPVVDAQTAVRSGGEFQVNTYTTGDQYRPAVAMQPDGGFGIVWASSYSELDPYGSSVQARLYTASGSPRADEGQVNTYQLGSQESAVVAADAAGNFVVVWKSMGSSGSDTDLTSIQAQRFDPDGLPRGGQFQVNTATTGRQQGPAVAVASGGGFVVVWLSGHLASDGNDIWGRVFASNGASIGGEFLVNTYTTGDQSGPAVATNAEGAFVVVWTSEGSDGSDHSGSSIQGRLFGADGTPASAQAQVNTYVVGRQVGPSVAANAEGAFVVVWTSEDSGGSDGDSYSIQGRFYASNGLPVDREGQVNTYVTGKQWIPAVAANAEGDFVVVWRSGGSWGSDQDGTSIQGRLFASNGLPIGVEAQVNSFTTSVQDAPAVAIDQHGDFVVVWHSYGWGSSDGDGYATKGQLYIRPLFIDGFESGTLAAWSSFHP